MSSTTAMWSGRSRRASRRTAALSSCTTSVGRRSIRPRAMASRRRGEAWAQNRSRRTRRCSTRRSCERVGGHPDLHAAFPPKTRAPSAPLTKRLFRHLRGSPAVFVTHELLRRETVEERAYQVNIARACLERSTLVVLPTGMGKTVIAAMVIAEVLRRRGGRILFLAPTKPLVEQHAASMRKVLVVDRITLFTGEATAPEDRELLWRENKIIVSTPQVIRNDLRAERISLDDVSLIVFDEAHRAVGDYAYVDVAAAYKDVPGRLVLGMTASPGSSAEKILEVCGNLGITAVEIRTEYDPDVVPYQHDLQIERIPVEAPDVSKEIRKLLQHAKVQEAIQLAEATEVEHPKLAKTGWIVRKQFMEKPDSKIIVFAHYRQTADRITQDLARIPSVRPMRFVGQASRGEDIGLSQKEQVHILEKFRAREVNVLVATSIGEEGLDIPQVDLVVFYEPVPSEIRTIQRRGRTGRSAAGRVIMLVTKDTRDEAYLYSARRKERKMHVELDRLRKELKQKIFVGEPSGETFVAAAPERRIEDLRAQSREPPRLPEPRPRASKKGQTTVEDF